MSSGDWLHTILGLISGGALVGIIGAWIAVRKMRPEIQQIQASTEKTDAEAGKVAAEAAQIIAGLWRDLSQELRKDVADLSEQVDLLKAQLLVKDQEIRDLEAELEELRNWIKAQGLTPPETKRQRERSKPLGKREQK